MRAAGFMQPGSRWRGESRSLARGWELGSKLSRLTPSEEEDPDSDVVAHTAHDEIKRLSAIVLLFARALTAGAGVGGDPANAAVHKGRNRRRCGCRRLGPIRWFRQRLPAWSRRTISEERGSAAQDQRGRTGSHRTEHRTIVRAAADCSPTMVCETTWWHRTIC